MRQGPGQHVRAAHAQKDAQSVQAGELYIYYYKLAVASLFARLIKLIFLLLWDFILVHFS